MNTPIPTRVLLRLALGASVLSACHPPQPRQPPGRPPTPLSVSRDEPGGDAANPEQAALERLSVQPWGSRSDKQGALQIALPDSSNWRRVKYWVIPTFTGFRYGDEHHGVAAVFFRDAPEKGAGAEACLRDFEAWGGGFASLLGLRITAGTERLIEWRGKSVAVRSREGAITWAFEPRRYAAVYASYVPWEGTCATLGYGFPMKEAPELALRVRDRFAVEAFGRFFSRLSPP